MIGFSIAKLNIGLYVTQKREDGFHDIESLFVPIALHDAIELIPAKKNELFVYHSLIPGNIANNSCLKALELMQKQYNIGSYEIHLLKINPIGAGLGAGSANATKVIQLINDIEQLALPVHTMQELAIKLGSDNAFFAETKAKYVSGRGEIIEPCALDAQGIKVVVIYPSIHYSTAEAYQSVTFSKPSIALQDATLEDVINNPTCFENGFQTSFVNKFPHTSDIVNVLKANDAFYYSLSGSGSSFFGLFSPDQDISSDIYQFCKKNNYKYLNTKIL